MLNKRAIVTPDKHFPCADIPAIKAVCKAIELVKPSIYVDLGDTGEWEAFSKHKWRGKTKPPLEYLIDGFDRDVKNVNSGMDIIDEALDKVNCKEKHFVSFVNAYDKRRNKDFTKTFPEFVHLLK